MSDCDRFADELLDARAPAALSAGLAAHLAACADCQAQADQHFALFAKMQSVQLAPPPGAFAAITARLAPPAPSWIERLIASWQLPAFALAAAVLLFAFSGRSGIAFRSGGAFEIAGAAVPAAGRFSPGADRCTLKADSWVEFKVDSASLVRIEGPAEFQVRAANDVRLVTGRARFHLGPQPAGFAVAVDGGSVRVVGTRFTVDAGPEGAQVAVEHGVVEVRPQAGAAKRLEAGGEAFLAATGAIREPQPVTVAPPSAPPPAPTRVSSPPPSAPATPASPPSIRAVRPGGRANGGF